MVSRRIRFALLAAASLVSALSFTGTALAVSPNVVISQVWRRRQHRCALPERLRRALQPGLSTVSLDGASIQYASATEPAISGGNTGQLTPLRLDWPRTVRSGSGGSGRETAFLLAGHHRRHHPITNECERGRSLATGTDGLECNGSSQVCGPAQLARIVDLVGYGNANFFEGAGPAPLLNNLIAAFRVEGGCTDADNNAGDFNSATPRPRNRLSARHFCEGDNAPGVSSTTPANLAGPASPWTRMSRSLSARTSTSRKPWYTISCTSSRPHTAVATGGPQVFAEPGHELRARRDVHAHGERLHRSPIRI